MTTIAPRRLRTMLLLLENLIGDLSSQGKDIKVVIHPRSMTNDMRDLVKCVCNIFRNEEIQMGNSSIISLQDSKLETEINETNTKSSKYCST